MIHKNNLGLILTGTRQIELLHFAHTSTSLAPHEVYGTTLYSLISAGTELALYLGKAVFTNHPGYAAVFRVEAVGSDVRDVRPGDIAFCMGPHRLYQKLAYQDVLVIPHGLSPDQATFARLMGVTMTTLSTTSARPPQKVLVTGLGLVGHLASQIFNACGYEVIACDPVPWKRELAEQAGVRRVFERVPLDHTDVAGKIALVIECSGHEHAVLDAARIVKRKGEVVLVGVPWQQKTSISAHELLHAVFHRYAVVRSGWEWELPLLPSDQSNSIMGNLQAALKWLSSGKVVVNGLYETVSPKRAHEVYEDLLAQKRKHLGVVFDWSELTV
jgi:threonine dehydrogenase-like Zn-dependent dehydrogenase